MMKAFAANTLMFAASIGSTDAIRCAAPPSNATESSWTTEQAYFDDLLDNGEFAKAHRDEATGDIVFTDINPFYLKDGNTTKKALHDIANSLLLPVLTNSTEDCLNRENFDQEDGLKKLKAVYDITNAAFVQSGATNDRLMRRLQKASRVLEKKGKQAGIFAKVQDGDERLAQLATENLSIGDEKIDRNCGNCNKVHSFRKAEIRNPFDPESPQGVIKRCDVCEKFPINASAFGCPGCNNYDICSECVYPNDPNEKLTQWVELSDNPVGALMGGMQTPDGLYFHMHKEAASCMIS